MDITFISKSQAIVWALVTVATLLFYFLMIRPRIKHRPEFVRFRGNAIAWLKVRWDMVAAGVVVAAPSLWNGALDLTIAAARFLSDALPAVAGLDLSALVMPSWLETGIRVGAAVLPLIRRYFEKDGE